MGRHLLGLDAPPDPGCPGSRRKPGALPERRDGRNAGPRRVAPERSAPAHCARRATRGGKEGPGAGRSPGAGPRCDHRPGYRRPDHVLESRRRGRLRLAEGRSPGPDRPRPSGHPVPRAPGPDLRTSHAGRPLGRRARPRPEGRPDDHRREPLGPARGPGRESGGRDRDQPGHHEAENSRRGDAAGFRVYPGPHRSQPRPAGHHQPGREDHGRQQGHGTGDRHLPDGAHRQRFLGLLHGARQGAGRLSGGLQEGIGPGLPPGPPPCLGESDRRAL